jgi:POT family proton-dependent oligopeptide transporter
LVVLAVFLAFRSKINKMGPTGSPVVDAFKTVMVGIKEGSLDKAKPSALTEIGHLERHRFAGEPRYTDLYVSQIKSGLGACKVRT